MFYGAIRYSTADISANEANIATLIESPQCVIVFRNVDGNFKLPHTPTTTMLKFEHSAQNKQNLKQKFRKFKSDLLQRQKTAI